MNDKMEIFVRQDSYEKKPAFYHNFSKLRKISEEPGCEPTEKIKYFLNAEKHNTDLDGRGMRVVFNPNKNNSILPGCAVLTFTQLNNSIIEINDLLNDAGIDTDLKKHGRIYRYDNSFDLPIDNPYQSYVPVIKQFDSSIRQSKKRTECDTYYFGNKKTEIAIYDKKTESALDYNDMRIENRNYHAGLSLVDLTENYYHEKRARCKKIIADSFFKVAPITLSTTAKYFDEVLSMLFYFLETGCSKSTIEKKIGLYTIGLSIQQCGRTPKELLKHRTDSKQYRQAYELYRDLIGSPAIDTDYLFELYNELKSKFARAV